MCNIRAKGDRFHKQRYGYLIKGIDYAGFTSPASASCLAISAGFCPSCGARRMAESAALLVDEVLPEQPVRQWVLSFPFQLRFLFASRPEIMGRVLGIVYRVIATHLVRFVDLATQLKC